MPPDAIWPYVTGVDIISYRLKYAKPISLSRIRLENVVDQVVLENKCSNLFLVTVNPGYYNDLVGHKLFGHTLPDL